MEQRYKDLLDKIQNTPESTITESKTSRILLIDGLNLFFRNFATVNFINNQGIHVGGLGGFIRSLGSLVQLVQPTQVYVVFDGVGSSTNRKNLLPEYKSNRGINRVTNWEIFEDLEDENDAKVNQISRLIHYLSCLPIKVVTVDKAEADDVIAYLSLKLPEKFNSKIVIVSSDRDYIQLINSSVILYRPKEKEFYSSKYVREQFGLPPVNFLIYKTLLGDNSDHIRGVKGLGPKTLFKLFPEIGTQVLTLDDIFRISEEKLKKNKIYAQILMDERALRVSYKLMDLKNPILDDRQIAIIESEIKMDINEFRKQEFLLMYDEDGLNHFIRNISFWITDSFGQLSSYK